VNRQRSLRPASVTIVCCILLIFAVLGIRMLIHLLLWEPEGRENPVMTFAIASPVLTGTMGIFMLRGANWARVLFFAAVIPIMVLLGWAILGGGPVAWALLPLSVAVLLSALLLSKRANQFFIGRATLLAPVGRENTREQTEPRVQRPGEYDF
jgi:hypothetical protein